MESNSLGPFLIQMHISVTRSCASKTPRILVSVVFCLVLSFLGPLKQCTCPRHILVPRRLQGFWSQSCSAMTIPPGTLFNSVYNIRKTCPCNIYHLYTEKLGYAGVYLLFLFLLQNIDCGYSLEPPCRGGSNVYPQSMF